MLLAKKWEENENYLCTWYCIIDNDNSCNLWTYDTEKCRMIMILLFKYGTWC